MPSYSSDSPSRFNPYIALRWRNYITIDAHLIPQNAEETYSELMSPNTQGLEMKLDT